MENEEFNIASYMIQVLPLHKLVWLGILLGLGVMGIIIKTFIKILPSYLINDRDCY